MEKLTVIINGSEYRMLIEAHETLASVLRNRLGLSGTKLSCEQGACGACTVLLDGKAVQSCITPAMRCLDKEVLTIEGLALKDGLHGLQQKFIDKGATQCGYCTPGMILTAYHFLQNNPGPSDEEIKQALSGNLCRCTGYKKIIEAVSEYVCEQNTGQSKSDKEAFRIGSRQPYLEAEKKVRGTAMYANDIPVNNALWCHILRSPYPHARILNIDTSEAEKYPGVRLVITGADIPNRFGVLPISQDETALAIEKTRYIGEGVVAVVADSEQIAIEACRLVHINYKPLQAFVDINDSLEDAGTAEKIHAHTRDNNNIHKVAKLRFGDQDKGFSEAQHTCEMSFDFKGINHGFTEPHAAVAHWDDDGLTVVSATQVPHYLHLALAKVLALPASRVRVIKPQVGGGFGGKSDPFPHEIIVAFAARKCKRSVRIRLQREEVFLTNHGRHPTEMSMRLGLDKNLKFSVLDADINIDGGAYGSFGVVTTYYNGVLLQAPYDISNFGFVTRRVYTNKPQCGAMRGHGAVNSRFAIETMIDQLAHDTGNDPIELRLKNLLPPDTLTVGQYRITSNGSRECLEKVRKDSGWVKKKGKLPFGRGIGVASGFFISGSALPIHWNEYPQSVVHLKLDLDGRVLISSGASDIGQGSDTMLAMIVAEVLGLDRKHIFVQSADTLLTPIDLGSYSSRVTFMAGNAAKMAAESLRKQVLDTVAAAHAVDDNEILFGENRLYTSDNKLNIPWEEAVEIATRKVGALQSSGQYNSPKLGGDFKGAGAGLSPSYSFGALVAEVEVNPETGMITVPELWGAHDVGKALNRMAVEGQLEGSWHMGLGQAMSEEMRYENGLLLNANFINYKIPTSLDTPDIHTNIIETIDPEGPFGAKECGEGALHPVIPAVCNAVFDAVGVRIKSLPISPEFIVNSIKKMGTNV